MTFLLADAKARKGILPADTTKDLFLQVALDTALALAEAYTNRRFMYAAETATFHYPFGQSLQLNRYPLEQVVSITVPGQTAIAANQYQVILGAGQIKSLGWLSAKQIDVVYAGGYKVLPADLQLALWMMFDAIWASMPGGGLAVGGVSSADVIKRISLPDVGSIDLDTSSAKNSSGSGAAGGLIPFGAAAILNLYRLEVC